MWIIGTALGFLSICTLGTYWIPRSNPSCLSSDMCQSRSVNDTITPIVGSKHLMISAYKDFREGGASRILVIINRDNPTILYCVFCCSGDGHRVQEAALYMHSVTYDYPYVAADALCSEQPGCNTTHVTLATRQNSQYVVSGPFLTLQNKQRQEEDFPVFLTVCMSSVFGDYNNVHQFVQTVELHKLLGVQKIVLYLTSCSNGFKKVLRHYVEEGILEIIPWPINQFLNPATGWRPEQLKGDIHLNGQLSVMNECIYRNMYSSQYVALVDVEEVLIPYRHQSLHQLMEELQGKHLDASVFQVETHVFPVTTYNSRFSGAEWVPGEDILQEVERKPQEENSFHSHKMVVNPRLVVQTAMFEVVKNYGETITVPTDVCKVMQVKDTKLNLTKEQVVTDKRLWEFANTLLPNVKNILKKIHGNGNLSD